MVHEPEDEFHARVERWLNRRYGATNVEHEPYQADVARYPDFVVEDDLATYYIEVENDADSVQAGVGQAVGYAAYSEDPRAVPVVVIPSDHVPQPEADRIRTRSSVLIVEVAP